MHPLQRKLRPAVRLGLGLMLGLGAACLPAPPAASPNDLPGSASDPSQDTLWMAIGAGEVYKVGEVRGFEYVQSGQVIGRSFGRYEGSEQRDGRRVHRFSSKLERVADPNADGGLDPEALRGQGEIVLDDAGLLVQAWERSEAAELRLRHADGKLHADAITGVPRDETWTHPVDPGAGAMGYMSAYFEEIMLATRSLSKGDMSWPLISLSTGSVDRWEGRAQVGASGIELRTSLGEVVVFADGRVQRIEVTDIRLEVRPVASPVWPSWEIAAPRKLSYAPPKGSDFAVRELELAGQPGDPRLAGEVLVPKGPGPHPAVVMLSASAATDRHGFAGPPAVDLGYHELGDALAQAGFVVIRFDDRGVGDSAFAPTSWRGDVEDGRRALRTLLVQPEVDPDRVLVVGHGEGGWRALTLAAEYPRSVVGAALIGSPGRSYRRVIGASQPEVLKALERGTTLPSLLEANRDWFREIMEIRPQALMKSAAVPIWIVFGDKDFEFDADDELSAWREMAADLKRTIAVTRYPGLDHLLKPESGTSTAVAYTKTRAVDPGFLAALTAWAREQTQASSP